MTNARAVRPTDLVALVSFDGRVYPNEAHTWERLGRGSGSPNLLENAFEHWFPFATGRHTWISIQGQTIRGVVSARTRGSRLAWEVDCLIVAAEDEETVLLALLAQLTGGAVDARVLRIFLRLEAGSELLEPARHSGFMPVSSERLFRFNGEAPAAPPESAVHIRPRERSDGFALYRLYNLATPQVVRRLEASTYAEWIAAQEKRGGSRGRLDVVAELNGDVVAWVRAVPDERIGRLDLLIHPDAIAHMPALVAHALQALGKRRPVFCLVPAHAAAFAGWLDEAGFERCGEFISMVKRVAVPVAEMKSVRVPAAQPLATV